MNDEVQHILVDVADKLRALGMQCTITPMSLPQGYSISLHVAESASALAAAYVATGQGGALAHASDTAEDFAAEVAAVIAGDAIEKAAGQAQTGSAAPSAVPGAWEAVGEVVVDTGQIMVVDPIYVEKQWESKPFEDIRIYHNPKTGAKLQYQVDFPDYEAVIAAYGKCMNELMRSGDWEEEPVPVPPGLSYNSVSRATVNGDAGVVAGLAVAFRAHDGAYPVFVRRDEDGYISQVKIDLA